MKEHSRRCRRWLAAAATVTAALVLAGATQAQGPGDYVVHNLVSDQPGLADHTDPNLVNAWGLDALPTSPWWVADNGKDVSTLYRADGTAVPLVVQVSGGPTGLAANGGTSFVVTENGKSGPARFLFDNEDGQILGWSPAVATDHAVVAVDRSSAGAIYKGLALAPRSTGDFLYAADFHNARVDMFDSNFNLVTPPGAFRDPDLPEAYSPFDIVLIDGRIIVAYAKRDAQGKDEIAGHGLGFVDAFGKNGKFLGRLASRGHLNAPWGIALAPESFGRFGGDLLVGNFGDGRITAYVPQPSGPYQLDGTLQNTNKEPIVIDGLWALRFGHGAPNNGPTDTLFFTAGPDDETHGLFGTIQAAP
jgi:uncharacterized protein (TIGR03118 family)